MEARFTLMISTVLLAGCAGSVAVERPVDGLSCPQNEVVVCTGGSFSRIASTAQRDRRMCRCEALDRVDQ